MHFVGNNGLNGLIIDGYTRDGSVIREMGIPQFTKGLAIAPAPRNFRCTPRDVNVPVSCGGTVVNPGDYVFGDDDGVLVVPEKDIDTVLLQAVLNMEYEKRMETALDNKVTLEELRVVMDSKKLLGE